MNPTHKLVETSLTIDTLGSSFCLRLADNKSKQMAERIHIITFSFVDLKVSTALESNPIYQ